MSMTESQRLRWNAAVAAHNSDPSEATFAALELVRRECLDAIHLPIIAEDVAKLGRDTEAGQ